ncbi:peptidase inhibitor family I36 protein [Streptomyces sp. NPDC096339]|uniref:peptidase inhibitor family I36 protein n=1 Tax=Streptomyces sp. NPDC096339 TaxID=3366086 RepID=UPI00381FD232
MKLKRALAVAAVTAGITFGMSAPASAASCPAGWFCLYYNSNLGGAKYQFYWDQIDLYNKTFDNTGAGAGQIVKNNAASAHNNSVTDFAKVYYNSNFSGPYDFFSWRESGNLVNTYNENASVEIY